MLFYFLLKKTLLQSKGQALVEFTISNLLFISLVSLGSLLIYISFLKYFNHTAIYNATLCVAKQQPILLCKHNLKKNIQSTLLFGKLNQLSLKKKYKTITGSARWTVAQWQFQKKIALNTVSLTKHLPTIKE